MSFRRVVALSDDHVAMCFSRADGAACKVAAGFAQHPTAAPEGAAISAASLPCRLHWRGVNRDFSIV